MRGRPGQAAAADMLYGDHRTPRGPAGQGRQEQLPQAPAVPPEPATDARVPPGRTRPLAAGVVRGRRRPPGDGLGCSGPSAKRRGPGLRHGITLYESYTRLQLRLRWLRIP
jgi:hypothetical protein